MQKTTIGSTLAAITGMIAAVAPLCPPQYVWYLSFFGALTGALATHLP